MELFSEIVLGLLEKHAWREVVAMGREVKVEARVVFDRDVARDENDAPRAWASHRRQRREICLAGESVVGRMIPVIDLWESELVAMVVGTCMVVVYVL